MKSFEKEIREACVFLRTNNNTIPDHIIQFMLDTCIEKIEKHREHLRKISTIPQPKNES